jgi:hypothetical protein
MRSIPPGSDGKGPEGLLTPFLKCSQKHLGHSRKSDKLDGDKIKGLEDFM